MGAGAALLRTILESISDGFVAFGPDWRCTYVNATAGKLLGRDPADLVGRNYWEEYPEAAGSPFAEAYQHCMTTREPVVFEDHYEPWDRWFENRVYPMTDGGIAVFFTEVTERKRAERALRESRERWERIADTVPDGVALVDASGRIEYANRAAVQILGLHAPSIAGRSYDAPEWEITAIDGGPFALEDLPVARVLATGQPVRGVEHAIRLPDGSVRFLSVNAAPILDEEGAVTAVVASFADITERVRTERALRRSEQYLDMLYRESPVGLAFVDAELRFVRVNEQLARINGKSVEEHLGRTVPEVAPDLWPTLEPIYRRVLEEGREIREVEITGERPATPGVEGNWLASYVPVRGPDGRILGVNLAVVDITERRRAEERIRFQAALLDQGAMAVGATDLEGRIVYTNRPGRELTGYEDAEALGKPIVEIFDALGADMLGEIERTGRFVGEAVVHHKDGTEIPVLLAASMLLDGSGTPVGTVGTAADLRPLKEAERKFRAAEWRFYDLLQNVSLIGVMLDRSGAITYANPYLLELLGADASEILGRNWFDVFVSDADVRRTFASAMTTGDISRHYENQVTVKDGEQRVISWSNTILRDADGAVIGTASIGEDVTERRRAEEEVRRYAERLAAIHEIDREILRAGSVERVCEIAVRRARALVPSDRATLLLLEGTDQTRIVAIDPLPDPRAIGMIVPRGAIGFPEHGPSAPWYFVPDLADRPGATPEQAAAWAGIRGVIALPLRADGAVVGWLAVLSSDPDIMTDENGQLLRQLADGVELAISQQRLREEIARRAAELEERVSERTEQLVRVNQELDAFAHSVAHDLRAPLRSMQGFATALLEDFGDALPPTGRDYAARVATAATRMDELIQDILAYARVSREDLRLGRVLLEQVVDRVLANHEDVIAATGAEVTVERPIPAVRGHRGILERIVSNLVGNALKFVEPGRAPRVRIRAEPRDRFVRLWVEDRGIGIAPQHRERVFGMLERLHGSETYAGTGVGLAIVRRGAERMGGAAGVEPGEEGGSRFWVDLPAAKEKGSDV